MSIKLKNILVQLSKKEIDEENAYNAIIKLFNITNPPIYSDEEWGEMLRIKKEHEKFMNELYE